jgi:hypothetical protein
MHKRKVSVQVSSSTVVRDADAKKRILEKFPKIALSDETLLHQKVQKADVYVATPYGTKYFAWITDASLVNQNNQNNHQNNNDDCVCLFIEARNIASTDVHSQPTMFYVPVISETNKDKETDKDKTTIKWSNHYIFHGILFNIKNAAYFAADHVYDCTNAHITGRKTFEQNMQTIRYIFSHAAFAKQIRRPFIQKHALHFGAPIMDKFFTNLVAQIQDLPYNIQYIYFRYNNRPDNETVQFVKYFKPNKTKMSENTQSNTTKPIDLTRPTEEKPAHINNNVKRLSHAVFKAYPLPRQDCYNLFVLSNQEKKDKIEKEQYVDMAYIPNYKTSIMMNTLLRNVKENENMDALEESDDEEEFENPEEDDALNLAKSVNVLCEYSPKFKKWVPMSVSEQPPISAIELGL